MNYELLFILLYRRLKLWRRQHRTVPVYLGMRLYFADALLGVRKPRQYEIVERRRHWHTQDFMWIMRDPVTKAETFLYPEDVSIWVSTSYFKVTYWG